MRAKIFSSVLTAVLLISNLQAGIADPLDDIEKKEREQDKRLKELQRKIDDKKKLYFAVGDIVKGRPIQAKQVEVRDVYRPTFPADAVTESVVGKTPKYNIRNGGVITVQAFGIPLNNAQLQALTARNYQGQKGKMVKVVFAKKDFAPGAKFTEDQIAESLMPEELAPWDSLYSAKLVALRKCKFGKKKLQLIMIHDLDY